MAVAVIMPKQGQSVESCIISKWHKSVGDNVAKGDLLFSYETDKAAFDEEAKIDGILLHIFYNEGDDVPVLQNVCIIGKAGESIDAFLPDAGAPPEESRIPSPEPHVSAVTVTQAAPGASVAPTAPMAENKPQSNESIGISPRARHLAERTGADYRGMKGSGPHGRIIEADIAGLRETGPVVASAAQQEYFAAQPGSYAQGTGLGGRITTADLAGGPASQTPASQAGSGAGLPTFREMKLSNIRKNIAKAMHLSISSTAQLTLNSSFDASTILSLRKKFKGGLAGQAYVNVTINDIILFAVSRVLAGHEALNAHFLDDRILLFSDVNLGLAVDTERGLMVPSLFGANKKTLPEISEEVRTAAEACRKGTVSPDSLKYGTFTVTNLGTLDIESFTPVLNPPQTGILGVNNITWRMKETDGKFEFYPAMGLSLTFDHRAVDGAPAARFLKDLRTYLEGFSKIVDFR